MMNRLRNAALPTRIHDLIARQPPGHSLLGPFYSENNRECSHCNANHPQYIKANFDHYNADDATPRIREQMTAAVRRSEAKWAACGLAVSRKETGMTTFPDADHDIWYSANRTALVDGYLSESMDGQPVAPLMGDYPDPDVGTLRIRTLPNFWNHSSCDHAVSTRLLPAGPQQTAIRVWWLVEKDAVEGRDYDLVKLLPFWQLTSEQDWEICERQQRGVNSSAYTPGPYSTYKVGSLRIALSERRVEEFRQLKTIADQAGLETAMIDNAEAQRLWPGLNCAEIKAVLWCPSDGYMTPYAVASSYAYQCRKLGVRVATATIAEEILCHDGRVTGVRTNRGIAHCRCVINAAGAHAYHIAKLAGIELPIVPVRHEYFVTVPMAGLTPDLPCFRVPDLTLYGRAREGGLLLGGWEAKSMQTDPRSYALEGQPPPVQPDWTVLNGFEEEFTRLFPDGRGVEKTRVGRGWPTFTPDGRFIIGESCRVKGFVMAGGCNAHGISGSAGIGRLVAEAILEPKPSDYVKSLSPDRFTETHWSWENARREAALVYETYYGV
jgi:glycine/D-amino acid oxidase-like deaminating enzyme